MTGRRAVVSLLGLVAASAGLAGAQPDPGGGARDDGGHSQAALLALLRESGGGDVVAFDPPQGGRSRLRMAARVGAPAERLAALLADPQAYRRAVPAFVRAEARRSERQPGGGTAVLLAWELEIPLWNLEGTLWMRPRPDGVELELAEGDLTPGRLRLRALADGPASILVIEGSLNLRNGNFVTRQLAARSPLAEPAMTASASYVLLRALALEAGRTGDRPLPARRPAAPTRAPSLAQLQPGALARRLTGAPPRAGAAWALVRSRPDGRLLAIDVALGSPLAPARLQARLREAPRWRALPGWKRVQARAASGAKIGDVGSVASDARVDQAPVIWEVDSNLPFVDFDAAWGLRPGPGFRAAAAGGDWQGPVMAWDVIGAAGGAGAGTPSLAAHALHPHLERTGYLPRKLIEAEPLLEHGLALGLAYVNAVSLVQALER